MLNSTLSIRDRIVLERKKNKPRKKQKEYLSLSKTSLENIIKSVTQDIITPYVVQLPLSDMIYSHEEEKTDLFPVLCGISKDRLEAIRNIDPEEDENIYYNGSIEDLAIHSKIIAYETLCNVKLTTITIVSETLCLNEKNSPIIYESCRMQTPFKENFLKESMLYKENNTLQSANSILKTTSIDIRINTKLSGTSNEYITKYFNDIFIHQLPSFSNYIMKNSEQHRLIKNNIIKKNTTNNVQMLINSEYRHVQVVDIPDSLSNKSSRFLTQCLASMFNIFTNEKKHGKRRLELIDNNDYLLINDEHSKHSNGSNDDSSDSDDWELLPSNV